MASAPGAALAGSAYVVLYKGTAVPADAEAGIAAAGGTLVARYDPIGVAIARSASSGFAGALVRDARVEGASATATFATRLTETLEGAKPVPGGTPAPGDDDLSSLQWDMVQIHAPEARAINGGSPSVVVGDIDTGLDFTHPDLAPNVDFANSASCVGGVANSDPAAWADDNGHGTHTAGTIAAARNGIGIVGVAPNVKIAGIKAGNAAGFFFPEAVICAFMWAGSHHLDVTNNSYYADPWQFNCRNDPEQRAIWKAEQRAIRYAMQQGVTVVAALTNSNQDLSKRNIDETSPDDGTPITREVTNACVLIPAEIPGVIGVAANGHQMEKSFYSNYGVGVVQVIAPGGDFPFQTEDFVEGLVLSTVPGGWDFGEGTSMASPHVAGVAALAISAHGKLSPGAVQALITQTADPLPCPPQPFNPAGFFPATCQGGPGYNGFNGHGQVNALAVVTE
ncbi:MAG TPA: S8 family serine peptidase [Gemmatimonadales bacterium]|nr:S8 family serine peptidase [Gemmatimonadales bacterium]